MGEVYRARDRKLNRQVALKIKPSHLILIGSPGSSPRRLPEDKDVSL